MSFQSEFRWVGDAWWLESLCRTRFGVGSAGTLAALRMERMLGTSKAWLWAPVWFCSVKLPAIRKIGMRETLGKGRLNVLGDYAA